VYQLVSITEKFTVRNFVDMPELKWPFGYPVVLGVVGVGCVLLYWKLKRDGWL
jgi:magnesium transporter